ncbi:ABC transporter permease [Azoarcus sp. L1K30]|uniref:ABC transporter permease n=1 Tax=Azoarcus sp. L1K30 TaxID=2820277 RepID=UPI001B846281|nr:ABC transporter permease [Azoarcus sp. L1K30]
MRALYQDCLALWRARSLLWMMARREIAARHAGSAAGMAWAYIQPMLTVAAYYLVFDVVFAMRLGENAPTRAVGAFLIVGALPWMAFCDAISRGMSSLIDSGGVLQKNPLPPVLFPARAVLASMAIHLPLIALVAIAYFPMHHFSVAVLALPLLFLAQLLLCGVLAYLLAILAAAVRDTLQVVTFFISVGIFLSPVLFPVTMFPEAWRWALWINPMSSLVMGYQSVLLSGIWPGAGVWGGIAVWLGVGAWVLDRLIARSRETLVDWL